MLHLSSIFQVGWNHQLDLCDLPTNLPDKSTIHVGKYAIIP